MHSLRSLEIFATSFLFSFLNAGSTRRGRASWATGYAWSKCKFFSLLSCFLYLSLYLKVYWSVSLSDCFSNCLLFSLSSSFCSLPFNALSSLCHIHCAAGNPMTSNDQLHLCFFNQKSIDVFFAFPSSRFSLYDVHFFSCCNSVRKLTLRKSERFPITLFCYFHKKEHLLCPVKIGHVVLIWQNLT